MGQEKQNSSNDTPIDLNFINPFILGAVDALQVQGGLKVEGGKPFLKGKQPQPQFVVGAVLGLTSKDFKGALSLYFQKEPFLAMLEKMFGEKISEVNDEYADAAAEILNITYGAAKTKLNALGYELTKALPTVLRGSDFKATFSGRNPIIVIPLLVDSGQIHIEISVDPN